MIFGTKQCKRLAPQTNVPLTKLHKNRIEASYNSSIIVSFGNVFVPFPTFLEYALFISNIEAWRLPHGWASRTPIIISYVSTLICISHQQNQDQETSCIYLISFLYTLYVHLTKYICDSLSCKLYFPSFQILLSKCWISFITIY